jgi:hypothetical protein
MESHIQSPFEAEQGVSLKAQKCSVLWFKLVMTQSQEAEISRIILQGPGGKKFSRLHFNK